MGESVTLRVTKAELIFAAIEVALFSIFLFGGVVFCARKMALPIWLQYGLAFMLMVSALWPIDSALARYQNKTFSALRYVAGAVACGLIAGVIMFVAELLP